MPAIVLWAFGAVLGLGLAAGLLAWIGTAEARKARQAPPTQR